MYTDSIKDIGKLENVTEDIRELLKDNKDILYYKGYGTPELEIKYLHQFFLRIQESEPKFESFSWQQCNEFNDNYYHFQLSSFTVNDTQIVNSDIDFHDEYCEKDKMTSYIDFEPLDFPDPEEIEYAKNNNLPLKENCLNTKDFEDYSEYRKKKYSYLKSPCLRFLTFLKSLEIKYSMYYFIYTFGNGVEVKFYKEGVTVIKLDENEIGGAPLDGRKYLGL